MDFKKYYGHIAVKTLTFNRFRTLRDGKTDDEFLNILLDLFEKEKK